MPRNEPCGRTQTFRLILYTLCVLLFAGPATMALGVTYQPFGSYRDISPPPSSDARILSPVLDALAQGDEQTARRLLDDLLIHQPNLVVAHELDGILRANQGDLIGAERALTKAITLSKTTRAIHMILGKVLFHQGKFTKATSLFQQYLRQVPKDITSHIYLGRIAALSGNLKDGIDHLETIMPAGGEQGAQALLQLIMWYMDLGEMEKAKERLVWCDPYCQSFPGYGLVKAKFLHLEGKLPEAEQLLVTLSQKGNPYPEIWVELGRVRREQGNVTGAKAAFQRANNFPDPSPIAQLELAVSLLNNQETEHAIDLLRTLVENDVLPDAYAMLAKVEASQGDTKRAESILMSLNQKHPDFAEGHLLMGLLQTSLGNKKSANTAFTQAVKLDPSLAEGWIHLANIASSAHHMKEAKSYLTKGMAAVPNNAEIPYHLGVIYEHEHQWSKAMEAYRAALKRREDYPPAMNNLALLLVKSRSEMGEAEQFMRRLHAAHPQDPLFSANLGWVLVNRGKVNEGVVLLEQGVDKMRENAELHYFLSVAYEKQDRQADAKKERQLAVKYGLPADYASQE